MKIKKILSAASVLLILSVVMTGCAASMKTARVATKFGAALKGQPVTSATAEISCGVTASNGEEQGSARFRTVVHSRVNWDVGRSYSDIHSDYNINGTSVLYDMQCYETSESGDSVRYLHMNENDLWLRLTNQTPAMNIDPALILVLMDTVAENTVLETQENPNTGSLHHVLKMTFAAEDIRNFAVSAGLHLPEGLNDCDLGGVTVPVELEIEDKTYLPIRIQIQIRGINSDVIRGLAAALAKERDVIGVDIRMDSISLLITNFGYEDQEIPMLPMGAAEKALDMQKVREIRNGK